VDDIIGERIGRWQGVGVGFGTGSNSYMHGDCAGRMRTSGRDEREEGGCQRPFLSEPDFHPVGPHLIDDLISERGSGDSRISR